jgi:hypothetical protein
MSSFERGAKVTVRNAAGNELPKRALSGVERGGDFPVVWVCREQEWEAAASEGREPDGLPWPAEDVRGVEHAQA